jgi:hypothetical protein
VDSKKKGTTFVELIFTLLIFSLLLIPISFGVQLFKIPTKNIEDIFLTRIRTQIGKMSSMSLRDLEEKEIRYHEGDEIDGFVFKGDLELKFTVYGQLKKGGSAVLAKGNDLYTLTVRPITGIVSMERE